MKTSGNKDWNKVLRIFKSGISARLIMEKLNKQGFYIPAYEGEEISQGTYWKFFEEYEEWAPTVGNLFLNLTNTACPKNAVKHSLEEEDVYEMLRWLKEHHLI